MTMMISATISTCIGEDLLVEIFKRLPVETLCRFLCVCKGWKSLISSSFFVNLHHSLTSSSSKSYLLAENQSRLCRNFFTLHRPQGKLALRFPFRDSDSLEFVGVIHGLVCFSFPYSSPDYTVLWNPAIRKYVTLPHVIPSSKSRRSIGFGYNRSKNDFKVVRIGPTTVEVYSTLEGRWRPVTPHSNIKCELSYRINKRSCFLNGAIHWILRVPVYNGGGAYVVLMFDCEREEFTTMELPPEIYSMSSPVLLEYTGMLALVVPHWISIEHCFDSWVMEEYGVTTSAWKKLWISSEHCFNLWVMEEYGVTSTWKKLEIKNNSIEIHSKLTGMGRYAYEESMFLMDDPKAQSYSETENVVLSK